jgi:NADH-quinone oxidoreductase subunit J
LNLIIVLLIALVVAALWSILQGSLIKAAIALAVMSILLTIVMFLLASPLAAVFELSICAGLITVIFMSTISLTKPLTPLEAIERAKDRLKRFWLLPVLVIGAAAVLGLAVIPVNLALPQAQGPQDVRSILWNMRQLDLLGQVIIILAGVFAVVVLFKEKRKEKSEI